MSKQVWSISPPKNPISSLSALSSKRTRYSTSKCTRLYSPPVNPHINITSIRGAVNQCHLHHLNQDGSIARQLPLHQPLTWESYIEQGPSIPVSYGLTSGHPRAFPIRPASTYRECNTYHLGGTLPLPGHQGSVMDGQTQVSLLNSSHGELQICCTAGNIDVEYEGPLDGESLDEVSSDGQLLDEESSDWESSDGEFSEENGMDGDVSDLSGSEVWTVIDNDEEWNTLSNNE
ncbi:hypothetical protein BDN71DRAFT_1435473 [Pleurotus eryngii]|uniref:Uncharacterized protein n=1 Tax=Pleurotus eryngii TaxID=5323 RepID=A0A9P5ZJC0_PLEER|nr:hypothetical protein BDN71DRAFT_1435473 [Pleurotus eryngii]